MNQTNTESGSPKVVVVIPNWNGAHELPNAVDSILAQSCTNVTLIIVDNGSTDSSRSIIQTYCEQNHQIRAILLDRNYGYTGGVNPGFQWAIDHAYDFVAPFNNDAVADENWLAALVSFLHTHPTHGIAACKLLLGSGNAIDSTGEYYTTWGLPYPRGRQETNLEAYDTDTDIFGASGGASVYRVAMLKEIGLFDQDFFAYGEDVDLSFRAQLAGWKVGYVPSSVARHEQGTTSKRMASGFTTYQTLKNYPWIVWKDVPARLLPTILPRFMIAYILFMAAAVQRRQFGPLIRGVLTAHALAPKKLYQRWRIQRTRTVSVDYIRTILTHDLPPNADRLRRLRSQWHQLQRRSS